LEARPGALDLLYRRGCLLLDEEYANYPQALQDLTAALRAPEISDARLFRATALLRLGEIARALDDLDAYVRAAPDDVRGYERRFEARLAAGRRRDALDDLGAAVRVQPRADLYLRLAALHAEAGDVPRAIGAYEEGITRLGRPLELMVALVDLAVRARATAKALEWLAVLEAEGGRRERWLLVRAEVLEMAGRGAEARAAYQEVLGRLESRGAAGGFLSQPMRLEQARALAGLGRQEEARAIAASLGGAIRGRAEYQRLVERLAE
jgi:tetratricopeptide (TPR) repeat protein